MEARLNGRPQNGSRIMDTDFKQTGSIAIDNVASMAKVAAESLADSRKVLELVASASNLTTRSVSHYLSMARHPDNFQKKLERQAKGPRPKDEAVKEVLGELVKKGFVKTPGRDDPDYRQRKLAMNHIKVNFRVDGHSPYWFILNTFTGRKATYKSTDLIGESIVDSYLAIDERFTAFKNDVLAKLLLRKFCGKNPGSPPRMRQAMKYLMHDHDMHVQSFCGHDWRTLQLERKEHFLDSGKV
ncbi:MAG: hypothetical protein KGH98_03810 [Candidatus Micrarchaeota archaeon]|nr:hypothetical protein [Candidatus Micrarchaeota archaeon]